MDKNLDRTIGESTLKLKALPDKSLSSQCFPNKETKVPSAPFKSKPYSYGGGLSISTPQMLGFAKVFNRLSRRKRALAPLMAVPEDKSDMILSASSMMETQIPEK